MGADQEEQVKTAFMRAYAESRKSKEVLQTFDVPLSPPSILYHYTNASGLKGIVESRTLWSSNAAFFNDSTELVYGLRQIEVALEMANIDPGFRKMFGYVHHIVKEFEVYATCFCMRGDLLNQWHGYGGSGGGYSVGFDWAGLIKNAPKNTRLLRVEYDANTQLALIVAELEAANEAAGKVFLSEKTIESSTSPVVASIVMSALINHISLVIATMKDPVFKGEEEWRLIQSELATAPSVRVMFRVAGGTMVPYIPTVLSDSETSALPISEIVIGPTASPLAERAVTTLLKRYKMWNARGTDVKITKSAVPLREVR